MYISPLTDRASFPQTHPQFRGMVPIAIGPLSKALKEPRPHYRDRRTGVPLLPVHRGTITSPKEPSCYRSRTTLGMPPPRSPETACCRTHGLHWKPSSTPIPAVTSRPAPTAVGIDRTSLPSTPNSPLTALEAFAALSELRPKDAILVNETASNLADLIQFWPIQKADTYYTFASGGLGWGLPASVGVALAEKKTGTGRPVVAVIGDGAFQYSIQSVYTAVQQKLKVVFIVPCNGEYAILKEFAVLEKTPNVPALDLPGLDVISARQGLRLHHRSR